MITTNHRSDHSDHEEVHQVTRPDFPRDALILGGNRIPFARSGGPYAGISNQDLLTAALEGLVARYGLQGEKLGEIAGGAVLKLAGDLNLTRESALGTPLDPRTPAIDMSKACATSLETVIHVSNRIQLGQIDSGIACGVDSASDSPIEVTPRLRRILHRAFAAKTAMQRVKAFSAIRPADLAPVPPRNGEPRTGLSMGEHQALTTAQWGITREAQDELALASHKNLAAAYDAGFFDDLVTGYRGLSRDQNLRADSTLEKLGSLKPVFGAKSPQVAEPSMTAGNSTPLSDGASSVLMGSAEWAAERGLTPLARVVDARSAAVDYVHGDEGLLMAPAYAVPELLDANGLALPGPRLLRDPRGLRLDRAEHSEGMGVRGVLPRAAGPRRGARSDRPRQAQRRRLLARGRATPSPPPAGVLSRPSPSSCTSGPRRPAVSSAALISVCAAAGQGTVVLLESVTD